MRVKGLRAVGYWVFSFARPIRCSGHASRRREIGVSLCNLILKAVACDLRSDPLSSGRTVTIVKG